jgi:Protein of unknown function (DUF4239)
MLSGAENAIVIVASMLVAIGLVALLDRVWPVHHRKLVNDVTGWQLAILGTTYGVILGFMLSTVWTDFRSAESNASLEAASVLNIFDIAGGLPAPQRQMMRDLAVKYSETMVHEEWPAMNQSVNSHTGVRLIAKMWEVLQQTKMSSDSVSNSVDRLTAVMTTLSERRSQRVMQRRTRFPRILWVLLILGGVATVVSACVLGNDAGWLHYCQVLALTFVVSVALAAIGDLARPFEGSAAVAPTSFERVLLIMHHEAY